MIKILKASKDAYITDRIIQSERVVSGNVGSAGTLDLFKLYGLATSGSNPTVPLTELSRVLIHFNLDPIRDLISIGKIDISNPSFNCRLMMFDVYGGQTTPNNYSLSINPLSRSFDEGLGRDIIYYGDRDVCNFLSGSRAQGAWLLSGANLGGIATDQVDYITSAVIDAVTSSMSVSQNFVTGEENLDVNVTTLISATLAGIIPDEGFRLAFSPSIETDNYSYFVKRFASRTAHDEHYHPKLYVKFDDSIQDDTLNLTTDSSGTLFLYNQSQGIFSNLLSASLQVTGSNSILLRLETAVSGGFYYMNFSGSQHTLGNSPVQGLYSSSIFIPSTDQVVSSKMSVSGSVIFTPIWGSVDGMVSYLTGSKIVVRPPERGAINSSLKRHMISVTGLSTEHENNEIVMLRVEIMNKTNPRIIASKLPIELPGDVIRDVHYRIRDAESDKVIIPFDTNQNSTRVSSDSRGMFFSIDTSNLIVGHSYVIDIMTIQNSNRQTYRSASPIFRILMTV